MSGETLPDPSVLLGPDENGERARSTTEEFLERHRRLAYTMDFNTFKRAIMTNSRRDVVHRLLEAMQLSAWYAKRDYPADNKGRPLSQKDLAEMIGSNSQRVSEAMKELADEFCVRYESSHGPFFLIDDPELEKRRNSESNSQTSGDSESNGRPKGENGLISQALEFLESTDPHWFKHYQKVNNVWDRAARKRKTMREEAIKRYQAAHPATEPESGAEEEAQTDGIPRTYRGKKGGEASPDVPGNPPGRTGDSDDASLYVLEAVRKLASYPPGSPEALVEQAVGQSELSELPGNRAVAISIAAGRLSAQPPDERTRILEHFTQDLTQLARRRQNRPRGWGILQTVMDTAISEVRRKPREAPIVPQREPTVIEQIEALEGLLRELPSHVNAAEWGEQLEALRARKPVESEQGEKKTRKAGQA